MRPIPLLTAAAVMVLLFLMVFQREALRDFVRGDGAAASDETSGAPTSDATPDDAETTATTAPRPETAPDVTPDVAADVAPEAVSVVALASVAREIDSAVVLRGETEAMRQVELRAETSGKVVSTPIEKGAFITKGQVICEIEKGTREVTLAEASARLAEAQINLTAAEQLSKGGYAAETRVLSARAAMQSAEAAVAAALGAIDDLQITAPFDGILESTSAELGSLLQPGGLCATVVQMNPVKLVGFVSEADVGRVEIGAKTGARLSSGAQVLGEVTFLSRAADPVTRTFRVEALVANDDLSLRDGQTAEILISSAGRKAHLLPQSSLTLDNEGRLGVRIVGEGNLTEFLPVTMLRDTVDGVWVAGLPETASVIVVGQDYVVEGVPLAVSYQERAQ
ncbi:MAG: efflux RND transporter periplasmic adaptor subunit [Maritimibacter sp.]